MTIPETPPTPERAYCCHIDCDKDADFHVYWHPYGYEDMTDACKVHLAAMIDCADENEAREFKIYPIVIKKDKP